MHGETIKKQIHNLTTIFPVKIYTAFTNNHRIFSQFLSADCRHVTTPCIMPITW